MIEGICIFNSHKLEEIFGKKNHFQSSKGDGEFIVYELWTVMKGASIEFT